MQLMEVRVDNTKADPFFLSPLPNRNYSIGINPVRIIEIKGLENSLLSFSLDFDKAVVHIG